MDKDRLGRLVDRFEHEKYIPEIKDNLDESVSEVVIYAVWRKIVNKKDRSVVLQLLEHLQVEIVDGR